MKQNKVIAFDADDTLWVNVSNHQETEEKFSALVNNFLSQKSVSKEFFRTDMDN